MSDDLSRKLEEDPSLKEKLGSAQDLDGVAAVLSEAGVQTSAADLLRAEAKRILDASDEELEAGRLPSRYTTETFPDVIGCVLTWPMDCCG